MVTVKGEDQRAGGKPARNQAIEALRIVSAYGIIAYHSGARFHDLAYSGLIVFLILAPAVDVQFNWERTRSAGQLARTLLMPWAFWWLAYGLLNLTRHQDVAQAPGVLGAVLFGTSAHLWFIPYMFMVLLLLNILKRHAGPRQLALAAASLAAAVLVSAGLWRGPSSTWWLPLPQWIHALPAVCIGVVLGVAERLGRAAIIPGLAIAGAVLVALALRLPGVSVPYAVGTGLTAIALSPAARGWSMRHDLRPVSTCMLGVYLAQILWLNVAGHLTAAGGYLAVTLAFALGLGTVYAARRLLPASRLVLG